MFCARLGVEAPWTAPKAIEANGLVLYRDPQSAKHALYIFLSERNRNQKNSQPPTGIRAKEKVSAGAGEKEKSALGSADFLDGFNGGRALLYHHLVAPAIL